MCSSDLIEHLVCLIKDNRVHLIHLDRLSSHVIHHTPRRTDNNLCPTFQRTDLFYNLLPSIDWKHFNSMHIFCQISNLIRHLYCEFSCRAKNNPLQLFVFRIDFL